MVPLVENGGVRHLPPGVVPITDATHLDVAAIGGKATSLVRLVQLGLRVPPAFVLTTELCRTLRERGSVPADVVAALDDAVAGLEAATGRRFGGDTDPLLLAVRSGAAVPMPGMMDTVLDVGFGPTTCDALAAVGGRAFARGCQARFLAGYAKAVLGVAPPDSGDPEELASLLGDRIPADPRDQLLAAIVAVARSWANDRARAYRDHHGVPHEPGTAVVVQAMAFGNRGSASGSGVASSRDPGTGAPGLCGDFLPGTQGEDVVDGAHRSRPLAELADVSPAAFAELAAAVAMIERAAGDLVDVEFAVEEGVLHVLQHRAGARAAAAAVRIAVDLVDEGAIDVEEALRRVSPAQLDLAARPTIATGAGAPIGIGLGACPGVATGEVCLSADHALEHAGPAILVRTETSPRDVHGLMHSSGAMTARGGLVSHAALVARELDLPTVVGVDGLRIDEQRGEAHLGGHVLREGDVITVDGGTGCVHAGAVAVSDPAPGAHLARFRAWYAARAPSDDGSPGPA